MYTTTGPASRQTDGDNDDLSAHRLFQDISMTLCPALRPRAARIWPSQNCLTLHPCTAYRTNSRKRKAKTAVGVVITLPVDVIRSGLDRRNFSSATTRGTWRRNSFALTTPQAGRIFRL